MHYEMRTGMGGAYLLESLSSVRTQEVLRWIEDAFVLGALAHFVIMVEGLYDAFCLRLSL